MIEIIVLIVLLVFILLTIGLLVYFFRGNFLGNDSAEDTEIEDTEIEEKKKFKYPKVEISYIVDDKHNKDDKYDKSYDPHCTNAKYAVREQQYGDYEPSDDIYGKCNTKYTSQKCVIGARCYKSSSLISGCGVKDDEGGLYGCPASCCKSDF